MEANESQPSPVEPDVPRRRAIQNSRLKHSHKTGPKGVIADYEEHKLQCRAEQ